jgi:hypothetical protein
MEDSLTTVGVPLAALLAVIVAVVWVRREARAIRLAQRGGDAPPPSGPGLARRALLYAGAGVCVFLLFWLAMGYVAIPPPLLRGWLEGPVDALIIFMPDLSLLLGLGALALAYRCWRVERASAYALGGIVVVAAISLALSVLAVEYFFLMTGWHGPGA